MGTDHAVRRLRARGVNQRRTILVGDERLAAQFAERLQRDRALGIEVLGVVAASGQPAGNPRAVSLPCLGCVDNLAEVVRTSGADLVFITLPQEQSSRIRGLMDALVPLYVDIHWVPDLSTGELLNHGVYEVGGQPVLRLSDSPIVGLRRAVKWVEDKVLATIILLAASPLMLTIAIAVKLTSSGPVLFKQRRAGLNGEPFVTYKFRSMVSHHEAAGQFTQAVRGDPRLTPIGAFLRRTSLDELPQFINVLQGQMSIVGPRPHALEHDSYFAGQVRAYMLRHRVKPGITGWAQVNGWRGPTNTPRKMQMRVDYDLYYINNWSLSFDLLIIAMTVWQVLAGKNAW
jgi:putative colanic acid biosynthesis UDP-glucose lipid carrier transferase